MAVCGRVCVCALAQKLYLCAQHAHALANIGSEMHDLFQSRTGGVQRKLPLCIFKHRGGVEGFFVPAALGFTHTHIYRTCVPIFIGTAGSTHTKKITSLGAKRRHGKNMIIRVACARMPSV